jgi:transcriptional regulator with XRE-family HTH domain
LATLSGVAQATVSRLERGEELIHVKIDRIRLVLESNVVEFIAENCGSAGVRLRRKDG